jgi:hypothetical protein
MALGRQREKGRFLVMISWKVRISLGVLVLFASCASLMAQGGPPLIGDDPGTPGNKHWEINIACMDVQASQTTAIDIPLLDVNYGLGDHIELSYEGGWFIGKSDDTWSDGWDDSQFGVKWRFLDQSDDGKGVDMSIYPQLQVNTTQSLADSGLVESGWGLYLPFEVAKTIGKWELDAEAGFQYWQYDRNQWAGGPIIGYNLTDRIELLGEARFVFDQFFRSNNLILDGGGRITVTNHMQILLAAGRGVRNGDGSPHLYLYGGLGFTF